MIKNPLITLLSVCGIVLCSCTTIPDYKNQSPGSDGLLNPIKFKYGKFCGGGHPKFSSGVGTAERTKDLLNEWPPVDDIDLICYAHDLCYQEAGAKNMICDQAINATAAASAKSFSRESGCFGLARLIATGITVKFAGSEKSKKASIGMSLANMFVAVPLSFGSYAIHQRIFKEYGFPEKEGTCFRGNVAKLDAPYFISKFEEDYREYAKGFKFFSRTDPGSRTVSIPMIDRGWNSRLTVFDMQKYLNYFGYNAGPADGFEGQATRLAIEEYINDNMLNAVSASNDHVVTQLRDKYLHRETRVRLKEKTMPLSEELRRFHYID